MTPISHKGWTDKYGSVNVQINIQHYTKIKYNHHHVWNMRS